MVLGQNLYANMEGFCRAGHILVQRNHERTTNLLNMICSVTMTRTMHSVDY